MCGEIDEREEELSSLSAIYPEIEIKPGNGFAATLELAVAPSQPLRVRFEPPGSTLNGGTETYAQAVSSTNEPVEHDIALSHLPPLRLWIELPNGYPGDLPPSVTLESRIDWLPEHKLREYEAEVGKLWEEYGRCQILFSYIDFLQQAAERGFDLNQTNSGCHILSMDRESELVAFDEATMKEIFDVGVYDCGVCLEPKKGCSCFQLKYCGHIFCRQCLQDFYNNAITEGDMEGIRCLDPDCGEALSRAYARKKPSKKRLLQPRELLAMGVAEDMVRRYVKIRRSKKMGADKSTVYCPRTWCQGPARSTKYPPIPEDLWTYAIDDYTSDGEQELKGIADGVSESTEKLTRIPPNPTDRLAVCEKCQLAFCKVCYLGWHGPFARCYPRDPTELSTEEKASYDYIRTKTSPCPTCNCPTQKTMGCNHMTCPVCRQHFCYLCGFWLNGDNPYPHFNKPGTQCYQRIWEAEAGEEPEAVRRNLEQLAIDAARDAEAQEEAARLQAEENERAVRMLTHVHNAHIGETAA